MKGISFIICGSCHTLPTGLVHRQSLHGFRFLRGLRPVHDGKGERVQHETSRPFPSTFLRSLLIPFLSLVVPPHSIHSNRRVRRSRGWRGGTGDTSNRRLLHSLRTVRSRRMRWQNGSEWVKREPRDPTLGSYGSSAVFTCLPTSLHRLSSFEPSVVRWDGEGRWGREPGPSTKRQ